jgi:hypothetical protein
MPVRLFVDLCAGALLVVAASGLLLISGSGVRVSDGAPEKLIFIFRGNSTSSAGDLALGTVVPRWCQTDRGHRANRRVRLTLAVPSRHSVAKLWWASRELSAT